MRRIHLAMATAAAVLFGAGYLVAQSTSTPPTNDWLLEAPNDTERFRRLQVYLRGFDQPMWEVGARWTAIHDALTRGNFDLAVYHWDKVRTTIENGYMKRPARRANSDALFLTNGVHAQVKAAFESRDPARAWQGFTAAREACIACHEAEKLDFMNDQAMFHTLTAPAN